MADWRKAQKWWLDERRRERLIEMHKKGMTYSAIAKILGTTKNSVAGMAARLSLGNPKPLTKDESVYTPRGVPLLDVPSNDQCRWPLWGKERPTHEYCRAPVPVFGMPYCHEHASRAYQKVKSA